MGFLIYLLRESPLWRHEAMDYAIYIKKGVWKRD